MLPGDRNAKPAVWCDGSQEKLAEPQAHEVCQNFLVNIIETWDRCFQIYQQMSINMDISHRRLDSLKPHHQDFPAPQEILYE